MVVDRINRAIINFIRKKSGAQLGPILTDNRGIRLLQRGQPVWSIAWTDIVRITALNHPGFVGDTVMMTIEAKGQSQVVSEEQDGWSALVSVLPEHLAGAARFEQWSLALLAGGPESTVAVYEGAA